MSKNNTKISVANVAFMLLTTSVAAAQTTAVPGATTTTPAALVAPAGAPSASCLDDLRAFHLKLEKDGYWLGGSNYGYGYPAGGWGLGYGSMMGVYAPPAGLGFQNARPGYEIRVLLSSANILAREGHQRVCEDILSSTTAIYQKYMVAMRDGDSKLADGPGWRRQQIAAAKPVAGVTASIRSDQLIGTELRNESDQGLGSVDDIILSPTTGTIAYLIVGRGGIFGLDKAYVPVPWADIKATPNMNMLVLDSTKAAMEAAPEVKKNQVLTPAEFTETSRKVDDYWKVHIATKASD